MFPYIVFVIINVIIGKIKNEHSLFFDGLQKSKGNEEVKQNLIQNMSTLAKGNDWNTGGYNKFLNVYQEFAKKIDEIFAKIIVKDFFEVLVSPSFSKEAINILSKRKNLILINSKTLPKKKREVINSVRMGSLIQENNNFRLSKNHFKIASNKSKLSKKEYQDLLFAFKVVKHTKSNAVVLVKNKQTVGIGAGQMNRYDATKIAIMKYKENFSAKNLVCASDAFFPFIDSLKLLRNHCSCIVSPSGSINDQKIIDFADKHNIKLIFSTVRVFKH